MNSLNQTSRWLLGLVALLFSAVGMAQVSALNSVPPWHLQYFSGSQGCDQLEEVLKPAHAQEWLSAVAESPIKRPGHLWLRLISAESIALSSSWIASVEHLRVKELLVAFVSDAEFSAASKINNPARAFESTLSRTKPARPFQFGSANLSVELPRNLDPGQSWLFCMTGISNAGDISQAFLEFYPEALFREKVLQRSQFETACLAIIFAMALSALFFAVTLRDQVYLWYTGHIIAFAVFELRVNGTLFRWLDALPGTPLLTYMLGDLALGVSVFCSCKFALVFLDLPHSFASRPGWHSLIKWLERVALLTLFFSLATILYRIPQLTPSLAFAPQASNNVVIALACIMVLACAIVLSWHGKRLAHFYLASSLPLVLGGIIATAYAVFIDDSASVTPFLLPLAAFEALVLSLGMADRALSLRLERDDARNSAEHDPLTNKLNRRGLLARLQQAQERTRQNAAESCALLYCDLDFFKRINDEYGHDAGDHCLLHFSETVQEVLRTNVDRQRARRTDDIGRIGGEEFVALLHQCTAQNAVMIAERICAQVRRAPVRWKEQDIAMTVSIGVAMVLATDAPNAALTRADAALYRAKHQGRDRVCLDVVP